MFAYTVLYKKVDEKLVNPTSVHSYKRITHPQKNVVHSEKALMWLSNLGGDISIWWAYSAPLGYNRVKVEAKTWLGPVTMPTGAPVGSRFTKDLKLQIHMPT